METINNPAHEKFKDNLSGSPKTIEEQVTPAIEAVAMKILRYEGTFEQIMQKELTRVGVAKMKKLFPLFKYVYKKNLKQLGKPVITEKGFDEIFNALFTPNEDFLRSMNSGKSELEEHMKSFDDLGFSNQRVYNWRKSILVTLQNHGYKMSDFYFSSYNSNNKELLQHIAYKADTYDFLNSKGLINTGFCPITGEMINNTFNFNLFNRIVYLSEKGLEICTNISREEWNKDKPSVDYDTFQKRKKQAKQQVESKGRRFVSLLIFVLSFVVSWFIASPKSFKSYLGFFILALLISSVLHSIFRVYKEDENT